MVNNTIFTVLSKEEAKKALEQDLYSLLYAAYKVRKMNFGNKVHFCSIVNAKSGRCSEDCKFCSQSAHHGTDIEEYELIDSKKILDAAIEAERNGAKRFGIVTSGVSIKGNNEWENLCESIGLLRSKTSLEIDASLGCLNIEQAKRLKDAGLCKYHHNLETSSGYFSNICSTHSYEERLNTLRAVKTAGLKLCSGGLFGLGESWDDRIDLAFELKEIDPDTIPLNFLVSIPGTPMENTPALIPRDILRTIALYRLIFPDKEISVCGGREKNLRDLQSWIFYAGATGGMIGNYLTTKGCNPKDDLQMLYDLGLEPAGRTR